jgi:hypothetical protein
MFGDKRYNPKSSYKHNKGATMLVAIIIMAILIVFTFALTLAAYTLYASQNKNIASMKCAIAANSLSDALTGELNYIYDVPDDEVKLYPEQESYLYKYLRFNICQEGTWPYYAPGETGHTAEYAYRYFDLMHNTNKTVEGKKIDYIEGIPGKVVICIYWMLPEGVDPSTNPDLTTLDKNGIRLFVEVTCEASSQSYTAKKEYVLRIGTYDITDITQANRMSDVDMGKNSIIINPMGFPDTSYDFTEMWIWKLANED